MSKKSSLIRAGAVLAVALSAGHLVETMNAKGKGDASKVSATAPGAAPATGGVSKLQPVSAGPEAMVPAKPLAATPELGFVALPPSQPAAVTEAPANIISPPETRSELALTAADLPAERDCKPTMSLSAAEGHMISVVLSAPCQPNSRVVLRHAGLAIAESLDAKGGLTLALPALDAKGEVAALFAGAAVAKDAVAMPGVERIQRFAVQWLAADRFQLHALENGAEYGESGHIWTKSPRSATGGALLTLGDPDLDLPMMAEVYTWAADGKTRARPVIEAEVTELTCGRDMLGETLLAAQGKVVIRDLTLSMPDCTAVGDILVLNNLVPDVTLATAN